MRLAYSDLQRNESGLCCKISSRVLLKINNLHSKTK